MAVWVHALYEALNVVSVWDSSDFADLEKRHCLFKSFLSFQLNEFIYSVKKNHSHYYNC